MTAETLFTVRADHPTLIRVDMYHLDMVKMGKLVEELVELGYENIQIVDESLEPKKQETAASPAVYLFMCGGVLFVLTLVANLICRAKAQHGLGFAVGIIWGGCLVKYFRWYHNRKNKKQ